MRLLLKLLTLAAVLLCASPALAQPTITKISPTGSPAVAGYGGAGPNAVELTITGTGFSMIPKATRFVGHNNDDILVGVSCSSTTTCTAGGSRPNRVPAGSVQPVAVFAMVGGVKSAGSASLLYYGELIVTGLDPSTGPFNVSTPGDVLGGPFTSGASFPGTSSVYIYTFIRDYVSGCASTGQCAFTAPSLEEDLSASQGAYLVALRTPGGSANTYFLYGTTPATPTIASISPVSGPAAGGNVLTITGTGFQQTATATTWFTISVPGVGISNTVTASCTSDTTCTLSAPGGGPGGEAEFQAFTSCPMGTACAGDRDSGSIPSATVGGYTYSGLKVRPGFGTTLYTSESGQTAQYTVALYSKPAHDVHVAVSTSGGGGSLSTAGLDFTDANWNTPQTVTITGLENATVGPNPGYSVQNIAASADLDYSNLQSDQQFTNLDNESKNFYISPQSGLVTTRAGGTAICTVVLTQAPASTVVVNLASNDPEAGIASPSSLTFATSSGGATGWDVPRIVTVTGKNDGAAGSNRAYAILVTAVSADTAYGDPTVLYPPDVQVTNVDGPPPVVGRPMGDFDGNGSVDLAIFGLQSGQWSVRNQTAVQFGVAGDIPVPGDYNGDGTTDLAVFRPSTAQWIVRDQFTAVFGDPGDIPVPGDYNGDGITDVAVYRPLTGHWFVRSQFTVQFGGAGYIPIAGDFDGDGSDDIAIFQPGTRTWIVRDQLTVQYGDPGDVPVPGDYDGNGSDDVAVFRQGTGQWFVRNQFVVQFGDPLDRPVPADYNGDGTTDLAVYRRATGQWFVRNQLAVQFGGPTDLPVPRGPSLPHGVGGDFDGNGNTDIAVQRPSTGQWFVRNRFAVQFGDPGDKAVPADYNGDGIIDVAVFRPSTGRWFVRNQFAVQFGDPSDIPVPGDYNRDGLHDVAVFRPSTGTWYVRNLLAIQFGDNGDIPVPGDYNGDGITDLAVYRPSTRQWFVRNVVTVQFGDPGDVPVPGDYNGDGRTDVAVYRPSTGHWFVRNVLTQQFGGPTDTPVPGDYNGDGKTDLAVFRQSTGHWFVRNILSVQFGDPTDKPMVRIGGPQ